MADVAFKNVSKVYDKKVKAVKDLSFECHDKEFFAILGPSGCGKTSSLRMLAGLEEISGGDVTIGGRRVNDLSPQERNVAMSFENYGLYPSYTIFDNIAYPLRLRKTKDDDIEKSVLNIAKKLRLMDVLNNKPAELSSGQKQRVSIARALVRNPDVTIMDEPLSHLDAKMRSHMRSVIKGLHTDLSLTTIYVTHDQIEAMTMADKILIMHDGIAQQIGSPDEVYSAPANLFVAGFIGSPHMNLIPCTVENRDGMLTVQCPDSFSFPISGYETAVTDRLECVFGIRPHNISISHNALPSYSKGSVYVVEALGESTIISIKTGDTIICAEADGHLLDWSFDDTIYFKFDAASGHLFESESGVRIIPKKC